MQQPNGISPNNTELEIKLNFELERSQQLQNKISCEFKTLDTLLNDVDEYEGSGEADDMSFQAYNEHKERILEMRLQKAADLKHQEEKSLLLSHQPIFSVFSVESMGKGVPVENMYTKKVTALLEKLREISEKLDAEDESVDHADAMTTASEAASAGVSPAAPRNN